MTIANESGGKSHMSCSTCNRPLPGVYDGKPPRADANGVMHAWCCPSLPPATAIPQEDGAREGVARYFALLDRPGLGMHRDGDWVWHEHHLAEVARLRDIAHQHAEDLNDIADALGMPTGASGSDVVKAVREGVAVHNAIAKDKQP